MRPEPFAPTSATTSPGPTSRSTSTSAGTGPYETLTRSSRSTRRPYAARAARPRGRAAAPVLRHPGDTGRQPAGDLSEMSRERARHLRGRPATQVAEALPGGRRPWLSGAPVLTGGGPHRRSAAPGSRTRATTTKEPARGSPPPRPARPARTGAVAGAPGPAGAAARGRRAARPARRRRTRTGPVGHPHAVHVGEPRRERRGAVDPRHPARRGARAAGRRGRAHRAGRRRGRPRHDQRARPVRRPGAGGRHVHRPARPGQPARGRRRPGPSRATSPSARATPRRPASPSARTRVRRARSSTGRRSCSSAACSSGWSWRWPPSACR